MRALEHRCWCCCKVPLLGVYGSGRFGARAPLPVFVVVRALEGTAAGCIRALPQISVALFAALP